MNWMRRHEPPIERAIALASDVLPTPGTSSISRWPSANRHTSERWTARCLPRSTRLDLAGERVEEVLEGRVRAGSDLHRVDLRPGRSLAWRAVEPNATVRLRWRTNYRARQAARARPADRTRRVLGARGRRASLVSARASGGRRCASGSGSCPRGWWRRPPFLPVPTARYLAFRLETAYGPRRAPTAGRPRRVPRVVRGQRPTLAPEPRRPRSRTTVRRAPVHSADRRGGDGPPWPGRSCSTPASSRCVSCRRAARSCSCSRRRPRSSTATAPSSAPSAAPFRCPPVIRLVHFVRVPFRATAPLSRRAVFARDDHRCQYCGSAAENLDHVVPRSRGGPHTWENVVASCRVVQRPQGRPAACPSAGWCCAARRSRRTRRTSLIASAGPIDPPGSSTSGAPKPSPPELLLAGASKPGARPSSTFSSRSI